LYVTENGAAFEDVLDPDGRIRDSRRVGYLDAHLRACRAAADAGVPVRGYFAWSLLDNFEWGWGYSQRFGLYYVDYASQRRVPKDSALWYAELLRRHRAG
jgi:beta-glucosidase